MIKTKLARALSILLLVTLLFTACGEKGEKESGKETGDMDSYSIFVTIHPLESIAKKIAGDRAEVHTLLPPGSDPHTYEPRPTDIQKLANSAILFQIGLGLDNWATDLALEAQAGPRIVPVSVGVPVLPALPKRLRERYRQDNKVAKHGNPHVWMDPYVMSELIIPAMLKAIIAADPDHENYYNTNATKIRNEVRDFTEKTRARLDHLKGSSVILHHGSVVYFCRQFGIEVMDILEPFPGQEPTAKDLQNIIERAAKENPVAILAEPQVSRKPAVVLSDEIGIPIVEVDPLGTPDESYLELMQRNIDNIAEIEVEK